MSTRASVLTALLLLAGCSRQDGGQAGDFGENRRFTVVEIVRGGNAHRVGGNATPSITIGDQEFVADTGCNVVRGRLAPVGGGFAIQAAGATARGCPPSLVVQDELLVEALRVGAVISISGRELAVRTGTTTVRATQVG